jgi:Mitochondrial carrier protein
MQVSGAGISATVGGLMKSEGVGALYKGLFFAYGRELSYTSIKLGAYAPVRDLLGAGKDAPFYVKFLAGAITGGVGSVVGYVDDYEYQLPLLLALLFFHQFVVALLTVLFSLNFFMVSIPSVEIHLTC